MTNENSIKSEDTAYDEGENGKAKKNIDAQKGYLPVTLLSLGFMIFLGFQTWNLVCDKKTLSEAYIQQGKTLKQVEQVKAQLGALAQGTVKLSNEGNRAAAEVLDNLKKAGVNIQDKPPTDAVPAVEAPK